MPRHRTASQTVQITWLALGLGALVCAPSLLQSAQRMEDGPARDARLALARPLADLSAITRADRGWRWADAILYPPDPVVDDRFQGWAAAELVLPDGRGAWYPRHVSAQRPLRLWVAGDSLLYQAGPVLRRELEGTGLAEVEVQTLHSTGLARPDYFDWSMAFREHLGQERPDAVLFMVGANDGQPILDGERFHPLGSPEWEQVYEERVGALMDEAVAARVRMYWVELPVMRPRHFYDGAQVMNRVYRRQAARRELVSTLPIWTLFDDEHGAYTAWLEGPEGAHFQAREEDGVHFSRKGAAFLASHLRGLLGREWGLSPELEG